MDLRPKIIAREEIVQIQKIKLFESQKFWQFWNCQFCKNCTVLGKKVISNVIPKNRIILHFEKKNNNMYVTRFL